jgi:hypothetical protein
MPSLPENQNNSSEEIEEVIKLGFKFNSSKTKTPVEFINTDFPGLRLLNFLKEIVTLLGPLTNAALHKHVQCHDGPPSTLGIRYYSNNYKDPKSGLLFSRTFIKEASELLVIHDYLVLPEVSRGKKIGKKVLAACLQQYLNMSVSKIRVHAGLEDGGYVWAKAGFKAVSKAEVTLILKKAKQQLKTDEYQIVKAWYDDYYNNDPTGTAFNIEDWALLGYMQKILKNSDWHGEIDLTNHEELTNFKHYVSR